MDGSFPLTRTAEAYLAELQSKPFVSLTRMERDYLVAAVDPEPALDPNEVTARDLYPEPRRQSYGSYESQHRLRARDVL